MRSSVPGWWSAVAELFCSMVAAYVDGRWWWTGRSTIESVGLAWWPCSLPLGHDGAHLIGRNPRPAADDPDRERRRARRADVERRRAARALDDLIAALGIEMTDDQYDCIERWAVDDPSRLQHKSNYGVPTPDDDPCRPIPGGGWHCVPWKPCAKPGGCLLPDDDAPHNADSVVPGE